MLDIFSVLPTPVEFIKQLNDIIYNFLWKGPHEIARLATINDITEVWRPKLSRPGKLN